MTQFDFIGKAKLFGLISLVLVVGSIVAMAVMGFQAGIDFTGGIQLTLLYPPDSQVTSEVVRSYVGSILASQGQAPPFYVQRISAERELAGQGRATLPGVVITVRSSEEGLKTSLREALVSDVQGGTLPLPLEYSVTDIGAQVSHEIVNSAWQAILIALAGMLVYIALRFRLRYGVAAVLTLLHDVIITLGVFAVFRLEINLPIIAALLTVVGYSINATIVVFDRVRENLRLIKKAPLKDVLNRSINQSLTRALNTSGTTMVPIVILLAVGGLGLQNFAVAMLCGVVVGTYSSLCIASPILYAWVRISERMKAAPAKRAR